MKQNRPRHDVYELCALVAERLKKAGFEKVAVSRTSEAVYYQLPGRHGLLRVSAHRRRRVPIGMNNVVAKLTFVGNCLTGPDILACSDEKVETMIAIAVGQYILNSAQPRPPNYIGKRGEFTNSKIQGVFS